MRVIALLVCFMLFGLGGSPAAAATPDPLERVNRVTQTFNDGIDRVLVRPVALRYQQFAPRPVRRSVGNFFANLGDVQAIVNDLLQLKFSRAAADFGRVALNSTLGVAGLFEVAEPLLGLGREYQDFGLTLAHYGVGSGPYLVLPLLGPSTVREAFGLGVDSFTDPVLRVENNRHRNGLLLVEGVAVRADYLGFDAMVSGDRYLFLREAYLQRRETAITGLSDFELSFAFP